MTQFARAVRGSPPRGSPCPKSGGKETVFEPLGEDRRFGDRESEASGEGSATPRRRARGAPASPGPAVSSPSPSPRPAPASPVRGERPLRCALGEQPPGRLRIPEAAADQLRPAGPRLPAPLRPPGTRAPAPGGGEGGSGAARRAGGPDSPRVSPSARAPRCGTSPRLLPSRRGGIPGDGPPGVAPPPGAPPAQDRRSGDRPSRWEGALRAAAAAAAAAAAGEGCCFPHTGGAAEAAAAILNPSDSHIHTALRGALRRRRPPTPPPARLRPPPLQASLRFLPLSRAHVNAHASLPSNADTPRRAHARMRRPRIARARRRRRGSPPPFASACPPSRRPTAPAPHRAFFLGSGPTRCSRLRADQDPPPRALPSHTPSHEHTHTLPLPGGLGQSSRCPPESRVSRGQAAGPGRSELGAVFGPAQGEGAPRRGGAPSPGCPPLALRPLGRGRPARHPRAGPSAPPPRGPFAHGSGGSSVQRLGPASPTPRRSEGAGNGSSMSVLGSAPPGELRALDKGVHRYQAREWSPRRPGGGGGRRAHCGPEAPGEVGPASPRSSATLRFPQRRCPRRPGWDVTPPPASRGALHGGVRGSPLVPGPTPPPRATAGAGGPAGKMSPLGARSFARGSATGQRPPEPRLPCPRTGSRGSTAARRASRLGTSTELGQRKTNGERQLK
ncbi:basic proline-rich protein-like [Lontra canadensis]|uniref:basic proline-rich protein-like n=1 Tax=Lontra canadensis TaxID=76717 RepID=UPI0013F31E7B|nr:basic proline-rich protein-like [Lontra canadensis]